MMYGSHPRRGAGKKGKKLKYAGIGGELSIQVADLQARVQPARVQVCSVDVYSWQQARLVQTNT